MTIKNIILLILLTIFTIGIFWIFHFWKRNKNIEEKTQLSHTNKIPFSIKKLVNAITLDNIIKAEYTHTKVKIFVKSSKKINIEEIKKIKSISGTFSTSNSITIIVGNSAKTIAGNLNNLI